MPDKEKKPTKTGDVPAEKKKDKDELSADELDNVSGGYAPGRNQKKKTDPRHHHEDR